MARMARRGGRNLRNLIKAMNARTSLLRHHLSDPTLLRWRDVAWGLTRDLLSHSDVVALALERVDEGSREEEIRLAGLEPTNNRAVEAWLQKLVASESTEPADSSSRWAFAFLSYSFETAESAEELLKNVDAIYCDLEHPNEMSPFISWLPPDDAYDPTRHTFAENQRRLVNRLYDYLATSAAVYGVDPPKYSPHLGQP